MATPATNSMPAPAARTKLTVQTVVNAPAELVWNLFTDPKHIVQWNAASDDWHTTAATNELTVGGRFSSTMAAKDGSASFDFTGVYTVVEPHAKIVYKIDDGREVFIHFSGYEDDVNKTQFVEIFEAEGTHSVEMQQTGWQSIADNFKKYVEAHAT